MMGAPGTDAWQRELLKGYTRHRRELRRKRIARAGWWFAFVTMALGAITGARHLAGSVDTARAQLELDQRSYAP